MQILDQYILKRFLYNFFSSFFILMFIFIFQMLWVFIDELAGKGLDFIIIAKFIFYFLPNLTEKVLPLTVLLASIMTFGTFAENYEFAAMKASGISLQRAMLGLIILVTLLGGFTFFFANDVIPASEHKLYNLRRNIGSVKPAAVIVEGVFSDFEGINIKVDRKYGENDRFLDNVVIHKKTRQQKNNTVIKAKTGELVSSEGNNIIQLVLKDGYYYEDVDTRSGKDKRKYPFARARFETYTLNIELPDNTKDLEEERNIRTDKMKNISRLRKDIDSLRNNNLKIITAFSKNISNRMGAFNPDYGDSVSVDTAALAGRTVPKLAEPDTLGIQDSLLQGEAVLDLYEDWEKGQIVGSARNAVANIMNSVSGKKEELDRRYKIYNMHIISLHKKFALALSCIILFFVGAPLGAIIRKGGMGLPLVIAIILFLTYYFIGVFAGNYSKEGNIHPILGAWLSTLIMLPLGIFLTRKATADRGLMDFSHLQDRMKRLFSLKKNRKEHDIE